MGYLIFDSKLPNQITIALDAARAVLNLPSVTYN